MSSIEAVAERSRAAASTLSTLPTDVKNACLAALAERITLAQEQISSANEQDLTAARQAGLSEAKLRRLMLPESAILQMAEGLRQVVARNDPVGQVTRDYTVPSGLKVRKIRSPIGVIMIIYEARPNVTVDAFALCFKAGNACILKGGHEAAQSNAVLAGLAGASLQAQGVTRDAVALLTTSDREQIKKLLSLDKYIDLVIPRGGTALIDFVHEHSRIPTVQHFHGVCHIYVDATANVQRAIEICATAKTSAPATCNAVETILIHEHIASAFVPQLIQRLNQDGVEARGDAQACSLAPTAVVADDKDWGQEFLDLVVAIRIVPDIDAAIGHINTYGSNHTDAILTSDEANALKFVEQVQSSCTLVNASTRFNDGFQLGLGAEIGISTSKIHAYGPMGLEELTTQRYVVQGDWQSR